MADLFNISAWVGTTFYKKNAIVLNNNLYYYSLVDHTSGGNFNTDLTNGKWGGVLSYNGEQKPFFFWKPSYNYRIPIKPDVQSIRFGDGYVQDVSNNISNIILRLELQFNDRDLDELTAILHFLHVRRGVERFLYIPPAPYNVVKKFVCQEFDSGQEFYDKYPLNVVFEERV